MGDNSVMTTKSGIAYLPNTISILRIVLIPFFAAFLIYHRYDYAFITFVAAGISDALDGFLARRLMLQSELGKLLDPIADKLLVVTSFVILTYSSWIPAWLTITVISKDLFVFTGWILLFLLFNVRTVQPTITGKTANALQMFLVAYVLLDKITLTRLPFQSSLMAATGVLTVVAGLQYIYRGISYTNE